MAGRWEGIAQIMVPWCHQTTLPVQVDIHLDGSVTGMVGDATLVGASFQPNHGWLGRRLNLATEYMIAGNLEGAIVVAESILRERVRIPLDFTGSGFKGGLNTSGSNFGGKEKMWLDAAFLELSRAA